MVPIGVSDTATAIVRHIRVREGSEQEYAAWRSRVIAAQAGQPGWLTPAPKMPQTHTKLPKGR